jgi:FemAB-related protein (PEP-CTERM system-associated)
MKVYEVEKSSDLKQWDSYVFAHNTYPIGVLSHWKIIFENVFGYRCFYLSAYKNNTIQGILPLVLIKSWIYRDRFLISIPFNQIAGIISDNIEAKKLLMAKAIEIAKQNNVKRLEIRQNYKNSDIKDISSEHCDQVLDLAKTADAQWKDFTTRIRNHIRKADKSHFSVDMGHHLVDEFYAVYSHNMRDLAFPVFSKKYFSSILSNFKDQANIIIVRKRKPIGCMFTFASGDTFVDYVASTLRGYNKYCPNYLLYWTAIKLAIQNGHQYFDFGRSQYGSGTFQFKKQWGAQNNLLYYHYPYLRTDTVPSIKNEAEKLKMVLYAWKNLPLSITNFIGPIVRKNMPF